MYYYNMYYYLHVLLLLTRIIIRMFIIKNAGCDIMMCGDKAHGDLRQAIKHGGCGQTFKWGTLEIMEDTITNFQGQRVRCNPPLKYAVEIAAEKKKHGILVTDTDEMKMAELKLNQLEVQTAQGGGFDPDRALDPLFFKRPVLGGTNMKDPHKLAIMNAIRNRDPYRLLKTAVEVYHMNPKQRIDTEARMWREQAGTLDLYFLHPGTLLYGYLKILQKLMVHMLWCCAFGRLKKCRHDCNTLNQTAMVLHMVWFPLVVAGLACLVEWGEGPLEIVGAVLLFDVYYFTVVIVFLDNSRTYNTPLTQACVHGQPDVLRLLLQHGANPNTKADSQMTPMAAAYLYGNWECVSILESTYDQAYGHYNHAHRLHDRNPQEWLTQHRLRGKQAFKCNPTGCDCTPPCCARCFCRRRPRPRNDVERRRRNDINHLHNKTLLFWGNQKKVRWWRNCCVLLHGKIHFVFSTPYMYSLVLSN